MRETGRESDGDWVPDEDSMAFTTACATTSGVTDKGAGFMPLVIDPITKPGRAVISARSLPCKRSAKPWQNASKPALVEP